MRKLFFSLLAGTALLLSGCLDTIQEITINEDGSGTISNTSDMSAMIGLLKQMGGEDFEKGVPAQIDSTFSLQEGVDEMKDLTENEKELVKKGTARLTLDMKNEKLITGISFPFSNVSEIPVLNAVSGKILSDKMMQGMKEGGDDKMEDMGVPKMSTYEDYFETTYEKGSIKRKLNSEKYKTVESDEFLKGIREATAMGVSTKAAYVFNLPRPAKEVEGSLVKLSEDKKKVTLEFTIDDFFDTPEKLEFKIKY